MKYFEFFFYRKKVRVYIILCRMWGSTHAYIAKEVAGLFSKKVILMEINFHNMYDVG